MHIIMMLGDQHTRVGWLVDCIWCYVHGIDDSQLCELNRSPGGCAHGGCAHGAIEVVLMEVVLVEVSLHTWPRSTKPGLGLHMYSTPSIHGPNSSLSKSNATTTQ